MLVEGRGSIGHVHYTGEEAAGEVKKLLDAVVSGHPPNPTIAFHKLIDFPRLQTKMSSSHGKLSSCARPTSRVVSRAIPALPPSSYSGTYLTVSSANFPCSSDIGRNMRTWSSLSEAPRPPRWYVRPQYNDSVRELVADLTSQVYERGVSCIPSSVDLWTHYCGFKIETCHDNDIIRE